MLIEQNSSDVPFLSSRKYPFIVDVLPTYVVGFSLVISRDYYALFDKLELYMWSEDEIFRSRALLLGTISYIPQPLVYYRDGGISNNNILERRQYLHRVDQQCLSRFNFLFTLMRDMNTHGLLNDFNYLALDYSSNLLSYTLSANFLDSLLRLIPLLWRKGPPKVSKNTYTLLYPEVSFSFLMLFLLFVEVVMGNSELYYGLNGRLDVAAHISHLTHLPGLKVLEIGCGVGTFRKHFPRLASIGEWSLIKSLLLSLLSIYFVSFQLIWRILLKIFPMNTLT